MRYEVRGDLIGGCEEKLIAKVKKKGRGVGGRGERIKTMGEGEMI